MIKRFLRANIGRLECLKVVSEPFTVLDDRTMAKVAKGLQMDMYNLRSDENPPVIHVGDREYTLTHWMMPVPNVLNAYTHKGIPGIILDDLEDIKVSEDMKGVQILRKGDSEYYEIRLDTEIPVFRDLVYVNGL